MGKNAAIFFSKEGFQLSKEKLMGKHAANYHFLRGLVKAPDVDRIWGVVPNLEEQEALLAAVQEIDPGKPVVGISQGDFRHLAEIGCMHRADPFLIPHAWQRNMIDPRGWSLTGITHTTCSARVMDIISGYLTAPLMPWDALICTSKAVRDTIRKVLEAQMEFLRAHLGAEQFILPKLPLIPLGVDCQSMDFSDEERKEARVKLGIDPDSKVVLFLGRLSFHAKANPYPMYKALESAASGQKVTLIECGWHSNEFIALGFKQAIEELAPSIKGIIVDGRLDEMRRLAWASSDIFCSFSDNIQETFGLTPVEAMASGIPAIISDWNGYKDTIQNGVEGFRIPTTMPPPPCGADLAIRFAAEIDSYDTYCGSISEFVSVDIEAATEAFRKLFQDPELCKKMGALGKKRAQEHFDWSHIIYQYQLLWEELEEERRAHPDILSATKMRGWPSRMDPYHTFMSYPTQLLNLDSKVARGPYGKETLEKAYTLGVINYAEFILPPSGFAKQLLSLVPENGNMGVKQILERFSPNEQALVLRAFVWLAKIGVVKIL